MTTPDTVELTERECWTLLGEHTVARLAVDIAGQPDIFPINYVVDGDSVVFRSGAGTKLAGAVLGRHVAVEIDGRDEADRSVWSVVVKGIAREVDDMSERFIVEDLPLYPWVTSYKPNFVRIEPHLTTGRRFHVAENITTEPVGASDDQDYHPGAPKMRPG